MVFEFWVLTFFILMFLVWSISLVPVDNLQGIVIRGHTASSVRKQYANIHGIGVEKVILYKYDGYRLQPSSDLLLSGGRWMLKARPVVGDHIHAAMSIWIGSIARVNAEHDRDYVQEVAYEAPFYKNTDICKVPGDIAYTKLWPHAGVHTHCDGLIHIHPWSAPTTLRKEGLHVQLQLWFDQVGISYREWPLPSVQFPDGMRYDANSTHRWYMAEKKCYNDSEYTVYDTNINQVWLGHAYASYVLWYGLRGSEPPDQIQSHIDVLKRVGGHGYDGKKYPQKCQVQN
jgi:hypothetical protein